MRVLVVGGAGYVAGLVLPLLTARYKIRVLDLRRPASAYPHVVGDATDEGDLATALAGIDTVLHCAMSEHVPEAAAGAFDVNVKSVYLTLRAAHAAGVRHAVYISSMSVYDDLTARRLDETVPPDARDFYGLSKRLGEEVCRTAADELGISVNVLRLVWPTPDELWPAWGPWGQEPEVARTPDGTPVHGTAASDVAAAVLAALEYRDGFQIFTISGDDSAQLWSTAKARRLLGWAPTFHSPERAIDV